MMGFSNPIYDITVKVTEIEFSYIVQSKNLETAQQAAKDKLLSGLERNHTSSEIQNTTTGEFHSHYAQFEPNSKPLKKGICAYKSLSPLTTNTKNTAA